MIRKANLEDLEALMPLAERFYNMCPWVEISAFSPDNAKAGLANILSNDNAAIFVIDAPGRLLGTFGVMLAPVWLSADFVIANELFWWVEPGGERQSLALWKAGEDWAAKSGAKASTMIRLEGMRNETLHRLYVRRGYNPIEHHYVRKLV